MCDLTIKDLVDEIVDHFNDGLSEADERCRDKAEDEAHYNELFKDYLRVPIQALASRCYDMGYCHAGGFLGLGMSVSEVEIEAKRQLLTSFEDAIWQAADSVHFAKDWWGEEEHGPKLIQTLIGMLVVAADKYATALAEAKCEELEIYKQAMESMAAQFIHPKMTALELAKSQLGGKQ